jgi:hypothetical protein
VRATEAGFNLRGTLPLPHPTSGGSQSSTLWRSVGRGTPTGGCTLPGKVGTSDLILPRTLWGAGMSGRGEERTATSSIVVESIPANTGEPSRDGKESERVGTKDPTNPPRPKKAVSVVIGLSAPESGVQGEGPQAQRCPGLTPRLRPGCPSRNAGNGNDRHPLSREPYAMQVACTVLTGGCDMKTSQSLLCDVCNDDTTRCPISGILRRCAGR